MAAPVRTTLAAWGRDRAGSVAVTTVLVTGVMLGMAALAVDGSRFYLLRRQQQTVTDLAAVAAAANIAHAAAAAAASLVANGVATANLASVELGTYAADPALPPAQRFKVGTAATANAARVTLRSSASSAFGRVVSGANPTIGTRSIAVNANIAGFALGTRVASLDAGLANGILGGLTGTTLKLSAGDYAGLAAANLDLFGFANALALRIGATGTYASLAATTVRLSDALNAAADAGARAGMPSAAVAALRTMATAIGPSGPSIAFGSLVDVGPYGGLVVGSPAPIAATVPVLPLVSAAARLARGTTEVSTGLSTVSATILSAAARIALGQAPAGSSYAAVGPVGTTLHVAETRVLLTLQLAGLGSITGLNLPLYVEVGPATATISAIGCSAGAPVDPAVTLGVTPGLVDAWIGNVTDAALTDTTAPVSPGAAVLTNLGLVAVSGRAHATVSNTGQTTVPFSSADIAAGTAKGAATTDYASSLLSQLFGSLQLSASVLGFPVAVPPGVTGGIPTLLQADLAPIDRELAGTLAALGVTIGDADTWVRAVRCGQGALVN